MSDASSRTKKKVLQRSGAVTIYGPKQIDICMAFT